MQNSIKILMLLTVVFTSYLFIGTGIAVDEFGWIRETSSIYFPDILIVTPIYHYTHMLPLKIFGLENIWMIDILKIIYINLFIYMTYKFISLFHSDNFSFLLSFCIVMFFVHDGATFWFIGDYIIFAFAFMSYSYYLIHMNKYFKGIFIGFIGSFVSYSSPIFSLSLSINFLIKKDLRNFLIFSIAPFSYVIYYIVITKYIGTGTDRIHIENLNIFKQYLLQIATYIDTISIATVFKSYYLLSNLSIIYYISSFFIVMAIFKYIKFDSKINKNLFIIFLSMMLIGFFVLSLTGGYYQMAFSLSNRVVFFTTIILVYLLLIINYNKFLKSFIIYIMILTLFATSLHWKDWSNYQMKLTHNILNNKDVSMLENETIFLYGSNASKLGDINHIPLSLIYNKSNINHIEYLNRKFSYQLNTLINIETKQKISVKDYIYVYFIQDNKLKKIYPNEIKKLLDASEHNYRHWAQTLDNDNIVKKIIFKVMPSLNYER